MNHLELANDDMVTYMVGREIRNVVTIMCLHCVSSLCVCCWQGDLIDAIDDPRDGWQFGESTKTGRLERMGE